MSAGSNVGDIDILYDGKRTYTIEVASVGLSFTLKRGGEQLHIYLNNADYDGVLGGLCADRDGNKDNDFGDLPRANAFGDSWIVRTENAEEG